MIMIFKMGVIMKFFNYNCEILDVERLIFYWIYMECMKKLVMIKMFMLVIFNCIY